MYDEETLVSHMLGLGVTSMTEVRSTARGPRSRGGVALYPERAEGKRC